MHITTYLATVVLASDDLRADFFAPHAKKVISVNGRERALGGAFAAATAYFAATSWPARSAVSGVCEHTTHVRVRVVGW